MKRTLLISAALLTVAVVVISVGLLLYVRSHGFSARLEPSTAEAALARRLRSMSVPRSIKEMPNPQPLTKEALSEAMAHFADHCAVCHANDGSGDTTIGKGLSPRPPDMRGAVTQSQTDGELYNAIHNGIRFTGMPAFGDASSGSKDVDTWNLVHFIRHLPKLSDEEKQAMKGMNPRSPAELEEEDRIRRFLAGEDVPVDSSDSHAHH
jgi:mono/diheme cytochrome c family protein